ncbi:MAG: pitrilysin family protein, partial [Paludibacteraceae bacterium]|nr:pitrilysin family protein [Paludibacteraceae bacterium]
MIKLDKFTLDNGLRVVHHYDASTPMVQVNLMYDIGSKDEEPEQTGMAHLFEHLMFEGSENVCSYDEPMQKAGGDNNAWTSKDVTNYYFSIPRENLEVGLWLESDRMLALDFNQKSLDVQINVVCEEFKQRNLNQPYGDVPHLISLLAFKKHPYGWPTIGRELSHIESVSLDNVRDFFFSHYAPNNAVLAVAGNVTLDDLKALVVKWFGSIPKRELKPRNLLPEPKQTEPRFLEVFRDVPVDVVYKVYHTEGRKVREYFVSDLTSDILANGRSARLYQRLVVEAQKFLEVNAYISGDIESGLFYVVGKPNEGVSLEEADKLLTAELEKLKQERVEENELEKVKNKFESMHLLTEMSLA